MSQVPPKGSGPNETPSSWRFRVGLLALALLALTLRLVHIDFMDAAVGDAQIHDALYYQDTALAFTLGESQAVAESSFANQGYIAILKVIYSVLGPDSYWVLLFQALLSSVAVFILGMAGYRLFESEPAGLLSAAWLALYAPAIHFDALLLIPSFTLFFSVVGLYFLGRLLERESKAVLYGVGLGVCIAISAALRPSQWLLIPACVLAIFWFRRFLPRRRVALACLSIAFGAILGFSPLAVEQHRRVGEWIPVTSNAGMNLWTGNHVGASGTYQVAPFLPYPHANDSSYTIPSERDAFVLESRHRTGNPELSLQESSRFWVRQAITEMVENPLHWGQLMGKKILNLMNDREPRTNADYELTSHLSPVLEYNPVRFGVLMLFAILGLILLRPSDRRVMATLGPFVIVPFGTCLIFFVSAEYRQPAVAALAIFAGWGLWQVVLTLRGRASLTLRPMRKVVGVAALLFVTVLAYLPISGGGFAKDARAYAGVLSAADFRGQSPTREDYDRARALLLDPAVGDDPMAKASLLLTESNLAIQLESVEAAKRFIEIDQALWNLEDESIEQLGPLRINRIRRNQMIRSAFMCSAPHIQSWTRILEQLQYLGCTAWQPAAIHLDANDLSSAEIFISRSETVAAGAPELLAYRGWLEKKKGQDPVPWLEAGVEAYPRVALPAILLARHYVDEEEWSLAREYAIIAVRREPQNKALRMTANRILKINPWGGMGQPADAPGSR